MNSETGKLYDENEFAKLSIAEQTMCYPFMWEDLTPKQIGNMQVSLKDNRSQAGKKRIKTYNNLRNKPCVCGSGRKFKKCCIGKLRTEQRSVLD